MDMSFKSSWNKKFVTLQTLELFTISIETEFHQNRPGFSEFLLQLYWKHKALTSNWASSGCVKFCTYYLTCSTPNQWGLSGRKCPRDLFLFLLLIVSLFSKETLKRFTNNHRTHLDDIRIDIFLSDDLAW